MKYGENNRFSGGGICYTGQEEAKKSGTKQEVFPTMSAERRVYPEVSGPDHSSSGADALLEYPGAQERFFHRPLLHPFYGCYEGG